MTWWHGRSAALSAVFQKLYPLKTQHIYFSLDFLERMLIQPESQFKLFMLAAACYCFLLFTSVFPFLKTPLKWQLCFKFPPERLHCTFCDGKQMPSVPIGVYLWVDFACSCIIFKMCFTLSLSKLWKRTPGITKPGLYFYTLWGGLNDE